MGTFRTFRAASVGIGLFFLAPGAGAQTLPDADVDCSALPDPKVFIEAGDTQMSMLGDLARKLRDAAEPITLVYLPRSTCTLADNNFNGRATTETMRYVPSIADDPAWAGVPRQCRNRPEGFVMDLGIGATFISSCSQTIVNAKPASTDIFRGPVQAYGFVMPEGTLDAAGGGITWDEAFYVFSGQGPAKNVVPWVQEGNPAAGTPTVYIRGLTTSTLLTCSSNVEPTLLPASSWVGYRKTGQEDRSSVVINGLKNAPPGLREATIGLLGMDLYDRDRAGLDVLAYQAKGQKFGFYPDSSPSKRDKRNVRDGHYVPWGYTEYLTKVDSSHVPTSPQVARILDIVGGQKDVRLVSKAGVTPAFDVDALEVIAPAGLIPDCAMQVTRGFDGGDLSLYSSGAPCGCFYETVQDPAVKTDHAFMDRCKACDSDANCDAKCRRGYCEAK